VPALSRVGRVQIPLNSLRMTSSVSLVSLASPCHYLGDLPYIVSSLLVQPFTDFTSLA